jgi:hypothetical protein
LLLLVLAKRSKIEVGFANDPGTVSCYVEVAFVFGAISLANFGLMSL